MVIENISETVKKKIKYLKFLKILCTKMYNIKISYGLIKINLNI